MNAQKPSDLGRPGHINPLRARNGGVLVRAGHTEAAVDLARLAGLYPAGALIEIINDDGTMAKSTHEVQNAKGATPAGMEGTGNGKLQKRYVEGGGNAQLSAHQNNNSGQTWISILISPLSESSGKLLNRRIPNGTYGGVGGREI